MSKMAAEIHVADKNTNSLQKAERKNIAKRQS
jgi:hypothetical protein